MATAASLGAALNQLLRDHGLQPRHRLATYHAQSWHAQLVQLTATKRGYAALEEAGLAVRAETLINWLSDPEHRIYRRYTDIIHAAYENTAVVAATPLPASLKNADFKITGLVKTGDDERVRGALNANGRVTSPLLIDGSSGNWAAIESKWTDGTLDDVSFEDDFIDHVIIEDIGEGTDGWEFPGSSYTVTI